MDDDLHAIATMLKAPEPAADTIDRSRHRLRNRILHPRQRRRRTTWWAAGVALTATAAVSAIVLTSVASTPPTAHHGPRVHGSPTQPGGMSGRQVLLAAATSAERAPASRGAYWHVSEVIVDNKGRTTHHSDTWTSRDGDTSWKRGDTTGDRLVKQRTPVRYGLASRVMTAAQVEKLPTDPAKLRAWMEYSVAHSDVRTPEGKLNRYMQRDSVLSSLAALLSGLPAPPKVRAAAFGALASFPDVRRLGAVDGGQGILIPLPVAVWANGVGARMVIDPDTGQVRNTNFLSPGGGALAFVEPHSTATVVAEWTDTLPT